MQLLQNELQIQIVPITTLTHVFRSSYKYLVYYKNKFFLPHPMIV